jgi:hypothetical protein
MLFKYKINLEVEVEFEAPLLGADSTVFRRKQTDKIAKSALSEMIKNYSQSYSSLYKDIKEENLNGTIKGKITLGSAKK